MTACSQISLSNLVTGISFIGDQGACNIMMPRCHCKIFANVKITFGVTPCAFRGL